ncbi:O-methyltransferase [Clostridia bacterium]|nr:O-methyltransferase [Clostridia bacterium]
MVFSETEILRAGSCDIYVSKAHRFGTDAVELFEFVNSPPRPAGSKPVLTSSLKNKVVWDLCTGCGIIALLIAQAGAKSVYGCDIAKDAVSLFTRTAAASDLQITPLHADLKEISALFPRHRGTADVVTVNPPYFRGGSGLAPATETARAARTEILCDIKDVITAAGFLLKFGGRFAVCTVPDRLADTLCAMRAGGIEPKILVNLVNCAEGKPNSAGDKLNSAGDKGAGQCGIISPWLCLIEGKSGGKPGMNVFIKQKDKKLEN